ncbi:MAG: hypothetical protein PUG09_07955 [Prevotella sp.]|nr:hypothetical protein [Prevotella sp.]
MSYDTEIYRLLVFAGPRGLRVKTIARAVFNASNTFFDPVSYDEVYDYCRRFLRRKSSNSHSAVEHAEVRGYYRLRRHSEASRQLVLKFKEDVED